MSKKKSFILYEDNNSIFELLSLEDRGRLITAIFEYEISDGTKFPKEFTGALEMAFTVIMHQLDENRIKWEETRRKLSEAGRRGGIASSEKRNQARLSEVKPGQAFQAVNDNANANANVNDNATTTTLSGGGSWINDLVLETLDIKLSKKELEALENCADSYGEDVLREAIFESVGRRLKYPANYLEEVADAISRKRVQDKLKEQIRGMN